MLVCLSVKVATAVCCPNSSLLTSHTGSATSARQIGIFCRFAGLPSPLAGFLALCICKYKLLLLPDVACDIVTLHAGMLLSPAL